MSRSEEDRHDQPLELLLDYGCTDWRASSQRAADLYASDAKLWRKEDFVDIEQQLEQSCTTERFTVRRIDGSLVHIKNPMFGVEKPIWKPYVEFREYWRLVHSPPDGPPETYNCTYVVGWTNSTWHDYQGSIENFERLFEASQRRWDASPTCEAFKSQFCKLLSGNGSGNGKKVTKVVCFGLGDMNFKGPDWWRSANDSKPENERESQTHLVEGAYIHHAIALTMADIARSCARSESTGIRLLTQDPAYSNETEDFLRKIGFEVVGKHGAGGFAELDDECIVFSAFAPAPLKQIIADLARPAAIICAKRSTDTVFHGPKKPYGDPDAPRTRQMWKDYEGSDFPVPPDEAILEGSLRQLGIYTRITDQ
ncbi:hypothetical protein F4777DRAFT_588349 [Nemania sp. FL0916]|nr:hypothetical protein F4777DRAFT_588349 [Nemania sp. FL0916]